MHALTGNIAQRLIDHALPQYAIDADKGSALDFDGEVAFARTVISAMAMVRGAVVNHGKACWREGGGQQRLHFDVERSFCHVFCIPILADFGQGQNHVRPA